MDIMEMKKTDFDKVPYRKSFDSKESLFDSIVIIPTKHKHESGYMCMDFVGCTGNEPIVRLSGCSDVLHIDGIGGYGEWKGFIPDTVSIKGWSIDCLPCGYIRIFCAYDKIKAGAALSSFEVFGVRDEKST